ncbi:extensin family protein [Pseudomonas sp. LS44]|nr:extensin family protein [Pseudomonas sp. LS44]
MSLAQDWRDTDREALFLRRVQAAACKHFNVTLGSDYNAAHGDHFHVGMGLFRMCR